MATVYAFALLDTKAQYFGTPFFCQSKGEAIRVCMDAMQDMRSTIARYPADFTLFLIGSYDTETANLFREQPENLGVLVTFLPQQTQLPLEAAATAREVN